MLPVSDIVKIFLNINSTLTTSAEFDSGLILGKSTSISTTDRVKRFESPEDMLANGFGTNQPEYAAAVKYFAQNPAPAYVWVGVIGENETAAQALAACYEKTNRFWGVYVDQLSADDALDVNTLLSQGDRGFLFYAATDAAAATADEGILASLMNAKSRRCAVLVSGSAVDAAAWMGCVAGLHHAHVGDTFSACYKELATVVPMPFTSDDVRKIEEKMGNVYITRGYAINVLEHATTASGLRVDEVLYLDLLKAEMQDALMNLIVRRPVRLPQNDTTSALMSNVLSEVLSSFTDRGFLSTGTWRGAAVGNLASGDVMEGGYYININSYTQQSLADREAHKAMPITVCLHLAGSVESVELTVNVQR